ncbi:MAG: hypothetical protein NWF06_11450 [Candidatus Bathyarchaeota archaeon]|nr:hypothetical protein [Candidatus Bathyarchaeum sp.]
METVDLKNVVFTGIKRTVNKFREHPCLFFTEMDIHSYLYHCLYSSKLEVNTKDRVVTTCLHKEYPTNFRFDKKSMRDYGLDREGRRGNYDFVVLNPNFVAEFDIQNVVNKNVRDVEARSRNEDKFRNELVAAIELKYVINNKKQFIKEVKKDIEKLSLAQNRQNFEAYVIVFCNHKYRYLDDLKQVIIKKDQKVKRLLVISYYTKSGKVTPKPMTNGWIIYWSLICKYEENRIRYF